MIYDAQSKKFSIYVDIAPLHDLALRASSFKEKYGRFFGRLEELSPNAIDVLSTMAALEHSVSSSTGPLPATGFFDRGVQLVESLVSTGLDLPENKLMPSSIFSRPPNFDLDTAVTKITADACLPAYHLNAFLAGAKTQTDAWKVVSGALMSANLHEQCSNKPGVYFFTNTGKPHLVKSLATGFACNQGSGIVDAKHSHTITCPAVLLFVRDDYFQVPAVRDEAHLRSLLAPILSLDQRSINEECPICLESMEETRAKGGSEATSIQTFLCGHTLCSTCASDELPTCPSCRCADKNPISRVSIIQTDIVARLRGLRGGARA